MSNGVVACLVALALAWIQNCAAAEHEVLSRLRGCQQEQDDGARLRCYDREVAALTRPAVAAAVAAPATVAAAEPAAKSAQENFGVQGSELARRQQPEDEASPKLKTLNATVAAVSRRVRGELVVTLDNGQVWVQKRPESSFSVAAGDPVVINAGALGSYRMVAGRRSTQVTRMQ